MDCFDLNILGCGSATPTARHNPSCQVLNFRDRLLMIDCGEGAQISMRRFGLKFSRLNSIFISHLHGDHLFGLPGLLGTLALQGRAGTIDVYMLPGGIKVVRPFIDAFHHDLPFNANFIPIEPRRQVIYDSDSLTVETFPLYHRVRCCGFIFREKPRQRGMRPDMIQYHEIPFSQINSIKDGADYVKPDGTVIPNDWLTLPPRPSLSYAYCSDTAYDPRVAESVNGVDVVYHEATYANDYAATARQRGHSTAAQAAMIARDAGAKWLVIGHYSQRYKDISQLRDEASAIFPNVICADEGMTIPLADPAAFTMGFGRD